jgi:imidazolonepropionase-like amidohydrolase
MLLLVACASPASSDSAAPAAHVVLTGATVVGTGTADVELDAGLILGVGVPVGADVSTIDVSGKWIVPAFIDSHVHLAYLPEGEEMAAGGVAGAVDLAAPTSFLAEDHAPLRVVAAGPMVTAPSGYPTESWGRNGYGVECADPAAAEAAVQSLVAGGAGVIKVPVTGSPALDEASLAAAVSAAHALGVKVAAHATGDGYAAQAAAAGVDVLAHTPVETLSTDTLAAWKGRAVITTLMAFGGGADTLANLAALRGQGATVLYGTDFGNVREPGIYAGEIAAMQSAGMDGAAILAAGTSAPAAYWGMDQLGAIAAGKDASFLVLARDPLLDPTVLAEPDAVWIRGVRLAP